MSKVTESGSQAELVLKMLTEGHEIRPFPAAVRQLLTALKDPNSNAQTFAKIIELDAALSTKILRMVNSPLYGFSKEIGTIDQAVTLLGFQVIKNLALAYAGAQMIASESKIQMPCEKLWRHSLGCGIVSRLLAKSVSTVSPDDAFLAGIFHDIGKRFFLDVNADEATEMLANHYGDTLRMHESERFGIDHAEVGLKLTVSWPLPDEIKGAICFHHDPDSDPAKSDLVALTYLSDQLARLGGIGSASDPSIDVSEFASTRLSLDEETLESVVDNASNVFEETRQAYAV